MSVWRLQRIPQLVKRGLLFGETSIVPRSNLTTIRTFKRSTPAENQPNAKTNYLKTLFNGAVCGIAIGVGYTVYSSYKSKDVHLVHERKEVFVLEKLPDFKITRKIVNDKDTSNLDLILFQFQTCPYCCKVRAFLDSMGFTYSIVEVDAVLRQDIKWAPSKKVPMVLARCKNGNYTLLSDSSMIISALSTYLFDRSQDILEIAQFYPSISYMNNDGKKIFDVLNKYFPIYGENTPKNLNKDDMELERKWREWTDSHFIHLISPNVYRTMDEALETFEWFSSAGEWDIHFPRWERNLMVYVGATAMYFIGKRLKKRHALCDDVRVDIYNACDRWTNELKKHNSKFLGGNKPNLADLAFYGALTSMEGCQAFSDILDNTKIEPWFRAMKSHVNANKGVVIQQAH